MIKNDEFKTTALNERGVIEADTIAKLFDGVLESLKGMCLVNSREFSLARTKLEEASFYAKKAMCNKPANQK